MDDNLRNCLEGQMRPIPRGLEEIKIYKDEQKWISSDSKMSIPGKKGNLIEVKRKVEIEPFLLAKYPVTKSLFNKVNGHKMDKKGNNFVPMVNVTWYDAITFCNIISKDNGLKECYAFDNEGITVTCDWSANGYRLPTEAEWQYACKAGTTGFRYGEIDEIAWYYQNSGEQLHEVGKKEANKWGLFDMIGNVWEWCWDLYDEDTYGTYRVFRGGSWCEEANGCGASCRRRSHPTFRIDDLGFRIARSL